MLIRKPNSFTGWLILLGAISFIPTLFFYMVGEEGIYVISTMEMWHRHNWAQQFMYGLDNGRPPLMNWLTVPVAELLGWSHVVVAVRLVSVAATLGMAAWLYWLSRKLFADKSFALFAVLSFLCLADLSFYRGWLSYTDPVFAFFTFGAMATLLAGVVERRRGWVLASIVLISCGALTKQLTAYVFYGTEIFVLLLLHGNARRFLLSPRSLAVFALLPVVLLGWFAFMHHEKNAAWMVNEILHKASAHDTHAFFLHLLEFPLETIVRLSPAMLLAMYLLLRRRILIAETMPEYSRMVFWIAVLSFLPYWISPQSSIRYLLPIYPVIAMICARIIWRSGEAARHLALRWFAGIVALKFVLVLIVFPYYQTHYRGANYEQAAQQIIQRTRGFPLYVTDVRSVGLSVAGYIDIARFPQEPLTFPPHDFSTGYVLSMKNELANAKVAETYTLAADTILLLCKGEACTDKPQAEK